MTVAQRRMPDGGRRVTGHVTVVHLFVLARFVLTPNHHAPDLPVLPVLLVLPVLSIPVTVTVPVPVFTLVSGNPSAIVFAAVFSTFLG